MTDDCFRSYVTNPSFFRDMLPISPAADAILKRVFTNDIGRVTLSQLRRLVLDVDTFFMSDAEIARSGTYVKMAAESYLCGAPPPSPEREDVIAEEVEVTCYHDQAAELAKDGLELLFRLALLQSDGGELGDWRVERRERIASDRHMEHFETREVEHALDRGGELRVSLFVVHEFVVMCESLPCWI